ncbi:hypothetical protein B0T49_03255 [Chromobacterium violaceum]|nr:hypothetical protein B0T48_03255 [Chromobacterium violaceum]OQS52836.1 hypothetical protein B0T49_03255 [Chromobacterium violaceum]
MAAQTRDSIAAAVGCSCITFSRMPACTGAEQAVLVGGIGGARKRDERPPGPCAQSKRDYFAKPEAGKRRMVFDDSVASVLASGQGVGIDAAGDGYEDAFHFHPTPGHCTGHMSITLHSAGETAIFTGDAMHSPVQVYHPEWNSAFCREQDGARASRRWLLDYAYAHKATVFTAHFGASLAGVVSREGSDYGWRFL